MIDYLKMIWPTPFKVQEKDVVSLVMQLVIFLVVCTVGGLLIGLLAGLPVVGFIFVILGSLLDIYGLVGIILAVLKFLGMVK
ncbi:MAG: hypothetical protein J6L96_05040 [Clostridia bacterium]|nr:hypothetical protein [Clostridia bacterium]